MTSDGESRGVESGGIRGLEALANGAPMGRRRFLGGLGAAAGLALWPFVARAAFGSPFRPEYASSFEELLVVYDQVRSEYLFREVLRILDALPYRSHITFLCSSGLAAEASKRLETLHVENAEVLASSGESLWGDWGRDVLHATVRDGETVLLVPYNKEAKKRSDLTRGFEVLRALDRPGRSVRNIPLAFEGGNLFLDEVDGERVLFCGNSVLVESDILYRHWFGRELDPESTREILARESGVDRVVPLGRWREGAPLPQASYVFHLDMGMALLRPGVAAVARLDLEGISWDEVDESVRSDLDRSGSPHEERPTLAEAARAERSRLTEAAGELEALADGLGVLGYQVHHVATDWRHVRRYQSYTNVLVCEDRLLMPIFPFREHARARYSSVPGERTIVEVADTGRESEFAMEGLNLANYELYRSLVGEVRIIQDYFYLAAGSIHCIFGRLA